MPKEPETVSTAGLSCSSARAGSAGPGVPPKRGRGRAKGTPRPPGAGRKKGTPNKITQLTRAYITKEGCPIRLLCQIASGKEIKAAAEPGSTKREKIFPTLMERLRAAETLARKIVPDMKAVEYSGPEGESLVIKIVRFGDGDHAAK